MLGAFGSNEWLLDFHESLAYLQQMDRVERIKGRYVLTQRGRDRLQAINEPLGSHLEHEARQIRDIAKEVRVGLGL